MVSTTFVLASWQCNMEQSVVKLTSTECSTSLHKQTHRLQEGFHVKHIHLPVKHIHH